MTLEKIKFKVTNQSFVRIQKAIGYILGANIKLDTPIECRQKQMTEKIVNASNLTQLGDEEDDDDRRVDDKRNVDREEDGQKPRAGLPHHSCFPISNLEKQAS